MRLLTSLSSLGLLAGLVFAQNKTIDVAVGGILSQGQNIYMFSPSSITAQVGDVVRFNFSGTPGNHSITQSTFNSPCQPMANGFDSGWVFIPTNGIADQSQNPIWNLTVTNASTPIWFYCKQLVPQPHCSSGMIGAINAPSSGNTFDQFLNNAKSASGSGQGIGALVGNGASASAIPGPIGNGAMYAGTPAVSPGGSAATGATVSNPSQTNPSPTNAASTLKMNAALSLLAVVMGITLA